MEHFGTGMLFQNRLTVLLAAKTYGGVFYDKLTPSIALGHVIPNGTYHFPRAIEGVNLS